jgi:peptide/nickel transport system substrate-binding protein
LSRHRRSHSHLTAAPCLAVVAVLTLAACGSSTGTSSDASPTKRQGTLTIGATVTPNLDPTQVAPPYFWPTYDTPIYETADGKFEPDLATSWGYAGSDNTAFQFTLRQGMKFTDGAAVTADAVAASMKRFLSAAGPVAVSAGPVQDVTAQGTDTVVIHYKQAVPYDFAVMSLTENHSFGAIVGPEGLKNPDSLAATPDGVGPYMVDAAQTTSGSLYTFVPNPNYFNQDAIHYDKVVIRTIKDTASLLSAAQAGQIDWAAGISANSVSAAKSAGLNVNAIDGGSVSAITVENQVSGPLADVKVRQAIAYAIPRTDIINAALGGQGEATSSVGVPDLLGYNADDVKMYDYNPDKAKALLAEAGYPNGLSLTAITQSQWSTLAQAVVAALENVGVHVDLTVNSGTFPQYVSALQSKKYDLSFTTEPVLDVYTFFTFTLTPGGTNNVFNVPVDQLNSTVVAAAALPTAQQTDAFAQVTAQLDRQAWMVPIALSPTVSVLDKKVQNVATKVVSSMQLVSPFSPVASEGWYGS